MFAKATTYAIKAMCFLALQPDQEGWVSLVTIASGIHTPIAYTAKVLQRLRKAHLVTSLNGPKGGFRLPLDRRINLKEIVVAIEGVGLFERCGLGLERCSSESPCPIHPYYEGLKVDLNRILIETYVDELTWDLVSKKIGFE
ncbi:MAG: Rrf2 family transcriptional regulator [Bacteroidetes Order II. Incertae sedis bacterium]|nr:Rrf2 family transcriptional regulator [Bacteroidetes Order II. bacterium]